MYTTSVVFSLCVVGVGVGSTVVAVVVAKTVPLFEKPRSERSAAVTIFESVVYDYSVHVLVLMFVVVGVWCACVGVGVGVGGVGVCGGGADV